MISGTYFSVLGVNPFLGRVLCSTPQKESEAEWRKSLTSFLMSGSPYLYVDNVYPPVRWTRDGEVSTPIDSASLASVLTESVWHDLQLPTFLAEISA